ncbi:hypothetical protein [Oceanobacillus jeddahense]|uniref:Uncharacterized protein n=1 Tax=Oceanobacillus jeddahense TaxID=1462527 RepID=A0ABY5JXM5_9BACI|nr:hypothetical protein [Oceanobacillus jeddahense]UUI04197.1 hypothetical protein NP439_05850 [Oceanobacillus jeddahense]
MKNRWISGLLYALTGSVMMFIVSFILGGEPYWNNIIGFLIGGFIYGAFIRPVMERKMKPKSK